MAKWAVAFLAVASLAGVALRFVNLDGKVYWVDEMATLRQTAGWSRPEMTAEWVARREFGPGELERYWRLSPARGMDAVAVALWVDNPELAPLYFFTGRLAREWWGDEPVVLRWWSAWVSVLLLPGVFWMVREWGGSVRQGWIAVALVAVSPLQLLFAQEARMYSLWSVMTVVSAAMLGRACRVQTAGSWRWYAVTVAVGWYTHLMFGLVLAAQALAVWRGARPVVGRAARAMAMGTLLFGPWLLGVGGGVESFSRQLGGGRGGLAAWEYAMRLVSQFSLAFWDVQGRPVGVELVGRLGLLAMAGWAVWRVWRCEAGLGTMVLGLAVLGPVVLMVVDVTRRHELALMHRYCLPAYLGVQVAVAWWLGGRWEQRWRQAVTLLLVVSGLVSGIVIVRAESWWTKGRHQDDAVVGAVINRAERPLVAANVAQTSTALLALGRGLENHVTVRVLWHDVAPRETAGFSEAFVYDPMNWGKSVMTDLGFERVPEVGARLLWRRRAAIDRGEAGF